RAVLGRHPGRAAVGVAALGLDAAEREHEAARGVAPVGAERHGARNVEGGDDLAARADADALAQADSDARIVPETPPVLERHAEVVDELERGRTGAALLAVDDDEVRADAGLKHRFADSQKFPRVADAELEARGLAARPAPHLADEAHHLDRRRERRMG